MDPYDETVPALAADAGATRGSVIDHYHYFEHGSHGYYEDYHGFEFVRGRETDEWQTVPRHPGKRRGELGNGPVVDPGYTTACYDPDVAVDER